MGQTHRKVLRILKVEQYHSINDAHSFIFDPQTPYSFTFTSYSDEVQEWFVGVTTEKLVTVQMYMITINTLRTFCTNMASIGLVSEIDKKPVL